MNPVRHADSSPFSALRLGALAGSTASSESPADPVRLGAYRHLLRRYRHYASQGRYDRWFARYSRITLRHALAVIPIRGGAGGVMEGRKDISLLDVACGSGIFAAMLKAQRPHLRITGVDASPDMLALARTRIPDTGENGVEWMKGFAEHLPVESGRFDIVTCTNAFHLVQDAPAALREFRRALRPGGTLVLVDWCADFAVMRVRDAILRLIDRQQRTIRTVRELGGLIEAAGLDLCVQERFMATPGQRSWEGGGWGLMCLTAMRRPETARTVEMQVNARMASDVAGVSIVRIQ